MEIKVTKIPKNELERIWIQCHEVTNEVTQIVRFAKGLQGTITGSLEEKQYEIQIPDILYIEAIDNRAYVYTTKKVYESKQKLYEMEKRLKENSFLRISRSVIVNLMKIRALKPALNGRFCATLTNGEDVIISRKYVPELKEKIRGGGR